MLKLISFVNNHGLICDMLTQSGAKGLFKPAQTRMCKMVIAAERVVECHNQLTEVFMGIGMYNYMASQGNSVDDLTIVSADEFAPGERVTLKNTCNCKKLKEDCIENPSINAALRLFQYVQSPIITLHRYHDTGVRSPNLAGSPLEFWKMRRYVELMPEVKDIKAEDLFNITFDDLRNDLLTLIDLRRKDCVSELSEAAAFCDIATVFGKRRFSFFLAVQNTRGKTAQELQSCFVPLRVCIIDNKASLKTPPRTRGGFGSRTSQ
jgi:hypothetical protein